MEPWVTIIVLKKYYLSCKSTDSFRKYIDNFCQFWANNLHTEGFYLMNKKSRIIKIYKKND
jgi:hypothetical protein